MFRSFYHVSVLKIFHIDAASFLTIFLKLLKSKKFTGSSGLFQFFFLEMLDHKFFKSL